MSIVAVQVCAPPATDEGFPYLTSLTVWAVIIVLFCCFLFFWFFFFLSFFLSFFFIVPLHLLLFPVSPINHFLCLDKSCLLATSIWIQVMAPNVVLEGSSFLDRSHQASTTPWKRFIGGSREEKRKRVTRRRDKWSGISAFYLDYDAITCTTTHR